MSLYRYYFFDSADRLKGGNCAECFNDQVAVATGSALLMEKPEAVAVEIWRDEQFIGGRKRDGSHYVTARTSDSSLRSHPMFSLDQQNQKAG
jgi:hypothetical protein